MQIERRKPRIGDVCLINLGIDRVRTEGKGLCSRERIGLGVDSMSEKEEREENGFDLAIGGGFIQPTYGVGLIRSLTVVYVGLTVMVAYVRISVLCVSNFG